MANQNDHTNLLDDSRFLTGVSNIMEHEWGRYVMRQLLATFGVRQSTFTGNAITGAHAQGYQEAGFLLEDVLENANASEFFKMLKENADENLTREAARKSRVGR